MLGLLTIGRQTAGWPIALSTAAQPEEPKRSTPAHRWGCPMLLENLELLLLGQLECSPAQLMPGCNSLWRGWGAFFEKGQSEVLGCQAVQD